MKDIHIGAHINMHSLVFTNPIAKYMRAPPGQFIALQAINLLKEIIGGKYLNNF